MITQDLGIATAYGYAKSKGYTGTEAEFAELMASYASTAQTAIEAADRAVEANMAAQSAKTDAAASKTAVQTAAQTATTKASEASQSASTATTKASEASQSASTASTAATSASTSAQTATTAATTATTKASEASESAATATTAKTDAETARDAAAQSASEAAESARTLTIDATLTQSGQAADAKAVGDATILTNETIYGETNIPVYQTVTGWRLNASDGLCSSNSSYQLVKYEVTAGSIVKVVSDDLFQFQSAATVPSTGASYRVGNTYGTGTFYLSVPNSATYIVLSTPISDSNAVAYLASSTVDEIKNEVSNLRKRSNNLLNANNADIVKLINNNGTTNSNTNARSVVVPVTVTTQTKITATKNVASSRFAIATFTDYPVKNSTSVSVKLNNSATSLTIAVDSIIKYVMIYFWLESADTTVTPQEVLNGMMVEFGDTFTEYEPYYVPAISDSQIAEITDNIRLTVTSGVNPLFYSTQLMAHRGTSTAPENTMSAYKQAYANGLRMMETDIKFSSDNIPVLLHDDTIDRTSDGSGTCSSIPLETLKTYDFGSWFSSSFAGEKIPTLAEFLVFCKTHNCVAELDLAESNYDESHLAIIYGIVKQCGMLKNTVFTVYNSAATILKSIDKNIILCIGGITNESLAYNAISKNYGCALLILSLPIANFSEQLALYIANLGCKVRTWVVNDAETAVTTFESCCDYILTDSLKKNDIVFD